MHPDQPGNVGNIGRSCLALGWRLHLVHPLGFRLTDRDLKRSGMDYWPQVDRLDHQDLGSLERALRGSQTWLVSVRGELPLHRAELEPGACFIFGAESAGLPEEAWRRFGQRSLHIPMAPQARSLNLASAVAMVMGAVEGRKWQQEAGSK